MLLQKRLCFDWIAAEERILWAAIVFASPEECKTGVGGTVMLHFLRLAVLLPTTPG